MRNPPNGIYPGESSFPSIGLKANTRYVATGEFRAPRKGEYYLSGAEINAYRAPNDLSTEYWIAHAVVLETCPRCQGTGKVVSHG